MINQKNLNNQNKVNNEINNLMNIKRIILEIKNTLLQKLILKMLRKKGMKNMSKIIINRIKLYKINNANARTIISINKLKFNKNNYKKNRFLFQIISKTAIAHKFKKETLQQRINQINRKIEKLIQKSMKKVKINNKLLRQNRIKIFKNLQKIIIFKNLKAYKIYNRKI